MTNLDEQIFSALMARDFEAARRAWIARALTESQRIKPEQWLESRGYVTVDAADNVEWMPDGRRVLRVRGAAYALRQDVHAERVRVALEAKRASTKTDETKSVVGTESLSAMVCPRCGDNLQHTAVCPKCAAGKLGYRHRYTCVCGGVDLISKEAL